MLTTTGMELSGVFLIDLIVLFALIGVLFFFFSSRRRHTRYIGDWSSDVCSSDLRGELAAAEDWLTRPVAPLDTDLAAWVSFQVAFASPETSADLLQLTGLRTNDVRSEERRVGKEGSYRVWRYQEKRVNTTEPRSM